MEISEDADQGPCPGGEGEVSGIGFGPGLNYTTLGPEGSARSENLRSSSSSTSTIPATTKTKTGREFPNDSCVEHSRSLPTGGTASPAPAAEKVRMQSMCLSPEPYNQTQSSRPQTLRPIYYSPLYSPEPPHSKMHGLLEVLAPGVTGGSLLKTDAIGSEKQACTVATLYRE